MPTYEYRCATCGGRFETFQSITSDALTTCTPELCQSENPEERGEGMVRRIVSGGAGVVFKGEGFYLTDYVRKGGSGGEEKSEKGKSPDASKGEKASKGSDTSKGTGTTDGSSNGSASGAD